VFTAKTTEPAIWTFFYGSCINLNVLREVNYVPETWEVASLAGFDILIQPCANLVRSDRHSATAYLPRVLMPNSTACMPTPCCSEGAELIESRGKVPPPNAGQVRLCEEADPIEKSAGLNL